MYIIKQNVYIEKKLNKFIISEHFLKQYQKRVS